MLFIQYRRGEKLDTAIVHNLVGAFGIEASGVSCLRTGVYRVSARDGRAYVLKRMRHQSNQHLRFIDRTLRSLREQEGVPLAWRCKEEPGGKRAFIRPTRTGDAYVLIPWIEGRAPDARNPVDLTACAHCLARFHDASAKVPLSPASAKSTLGCWPIKFREDTLLLASRVKEAGSHTGDLADFLREVGYDLLEQAFRVELALAQSDYQRICKQAQRGQTHVCHGDCGDANFVMTSSGAYLLDFETLRIDIPAYDIYRLVRLQAKANAWDPGLSLAMLDAYRDVRPLTRADLTLALLWLQFPRKAVRSVRSPHIWERNEYTQKRLHAAWEEMERSRSLLDHVRAYADELN